MHLLAGFLECVFKGDGGKEEQVSVMELLEFYFWFVIVLCDSEVS